MNQPEYKYRFSVLILNYNKILLARKRMAEVISYLVPRKDTETILIDNGSMGTDIINMFTLNAQEHKNLRAYRIVENQGFGAGFNIASKIAEGKIIILYSNDVAMQGDFLEGEMGQQIYNHCEAGGLACQRMIDWNSGWNTFAGKTIAYCEGYWLALSQKTWKEIKGFDTRYYPYDYEDMDLSVEVEKLSNMSFPLKAFPSLPINHAGAGTIGFTNERRAQTIKMRAAFSKKWDLPNVPEAP